MLPPDDVPRRQLVDAVDRMLGDAFDRFARRDEDQRQTASGMAACGRRRALAGKRMKA